MENRQLAKRFISFSKYSSLIIMAVGLFALAGWIFDIQAFKSVLPGFPTMKTNTALTFLLAGIALWVASQENPKPNAFRMAQICRGAVFLIGLLTLGEYIFGRDLGIDQLIFRDLQTPQASFPGRMAFATALCFTLIGAASIFIHARAGQVLHAGQYLVVTVLSISFLALVGYVYDVQALYKLGPYSSMALHTAVGLALLALGTLIVQAERGWMRLISTETAGGVVLRRLIPFVLGIPIFIGWLVVLGDRAGVYETHFGLAMISVLTAGFLVITLWLISRQLNRIDAGRKRAEEQIAYQANLLANVSDAIVASDAQFRLTAWNAAAEEMYGWQADEVLGRIGVEILQTEFPDIDAEEMQRKIAETGRWQGEATQLRKDGTRTPVEVSSSVLRDGNGQISGYLSVNRDITERKRVDEEIRKLNTELEQRVAARTAELSSSEARFRGLFEHAPVSIWEEDFSAVRQYIDDLYRAGIVDLSAYFDEHPDAIAECAAKVKILDVNLATLEMFQAESKTQLLADLSKILGPEAWIPFKEELLALARGATSFESETTNYTLRGERRVIFLRLTVAPDYEQTWAKVFVGISDITERRQAEARLEQSETLFRALFDLSPDAVIVIDPHDPNISWPVIDCNVAAGLMNGYRRDELIGQSIDILNVTSGTEAERIAYIKRLRAAGNLKLETYHRRKNGIVFPVEISTTLIPIGERELVISIDRDITERKQAEVALREAEIKYRTLVEHMPAIIYVDLADESRKTIYISSHVQEMLGYSPEDWITKPDLCNDIVHPEDSERMWKALQESEAYGRFACDYRYIAKDGRVVWVHDEAVLLKNEAMEPSVWQGVMLDITPQKEAEEALRQSEERFKLIAWATKDAVWDWDLQTNQIWWGEGLQKIFYYSPDTTQTNPEWRLDHIHPEDRAKVDLVINQTLEGGMEFWSKEYRFQRIDGTYADIMDRGYVIRNKAGKATRMIGAMMDITERKYMESMLVQSNEKMGQILNELQESNRDTSLLNELSHQLQACQSTQEAFGIIADLSKQLFPRTAGALYLLNEARTQISAVASWGELSSASDTFTPDNCNALCYGLTRPLNTAQLGTCCLHFAQAPGITYCLPIQMRGEILGIFHLQSTSEEYLTEIKRQLANSVVEQSQLALSNLKLREALVEQSIRDPLTELYNRRYMEEALNQQLSRVTRQLHPLGLIMIDIDHFKNFNDEYGHAAGDALLRELGRLLQSHVRGGDVACRYGGEEFLIIMPDASLETAHQRAVLLQQEAKKLRVQDARQSLDGITLSLGVAIYPEHGRSIDSVLRAADAALYRAKQEGRDRVVVADRAR